MEWPVAQGLGWELWGPQIMTELPLALSGSGLRASSDGHRRTQHLLEGGEAGAGLRVLWEHKRDSRADPGHPRKAAEWRWPLRWSSQGS